MLHVDPTTPLGLIDAAQHLAPVLAPFTTLAALAVAAIRGGKW